MRYAIPILFAALMTPVPAALAQGLPPLLIPAPPAPTLPPLVAPAPVPSAVTPLPSPSYGVPPGVTSTAPLGGSSTLRSIYRGSDYRKPKKRRWKRPYQSSAQ
jgi:hypothetical protein